MSVDHAVLYGAGDPGTASLRSLAFAKGIAIEFRDIRTTDASGKHAFLQQLHALRVETVPQLVFPATAAVLDYDQAHTWFEALPLQKTVQGISA